MSNVNNIYFDGHYKEIWKALIPDEVTGKETNFMMQYFKLQPGNHVLDLMCGYGRHSLDLARKGLNVTAVDNLPDYIDELYKNAAAENLTINAVQSDILSYRPSEKFELAICMGNSLQFFNKEEAMGLLNTISSHLKPGGYFLINTWTIMEIIVKTYKEKSESIVGDLKFSDESRYFFSPSRIESQTQITSPDGATEVKQSVDYIWSLNEMETMLSEAGMKMTEVFSIPGRKKFTIGEPRAYIVAQKS